MRWLCVLALLAWIFAGCHQTKPAGRNTVAPSGGPGSASPAITHRPALIVTPGGGVRGRIASVNANLGYVVVGFALGSVPAADRRLGVYRNGLKVGEIKITGLQRENNAIADMVAGECQVGDEVRENQ